MTTPFLELNLAGTPYSLEEAAIQNLVAAVKSLDDRIVNLRSIGILTERTLRDFYGEGRFEQVAESNALEGSTLSAGETELAVLKGITITGHDPAFVRDAIALDTALIKLVEIARRKQATDIAQVQELHGLILEGRPGAGVFRNDPVLIRGSEHRPPKSWKEVMAEMEQWEKWSKTYVAAPAIMRAAILHAWMAHIHPFVDGNGRISRAISNLELIRAGYPPIVIKKKERDRYLDALQESDRGGNIAPFLELILERAEGAVTGLERSAKRQQGFDPATIKLRREQERLLGIWNTTVELFFRILVNQLEKKLEPINGRIEARFFSGLLELDEYMELYAGKPLGRRSWDFTITTHVPTLVSVKRLCWTGFRSPTLRDKVGHPGPALLWSQPNPAGYPPWERAGTSSPGAQELTIREGHGNDWFITMTDGHVRQMSTVEAADLVADGFVELLTKGRG